MNSLVYIKQEGSKAQNTIALSCGTSFAAVRTGFTGNFLIVVKRKGCEKRKNDDFKIPPRRTGGVLYESLFSFCVIVRK